jgi:DNA-binding SARP family transcriptional activator
MAAETPTPMRLSLLLLGPYQATVGREPIAESRTKKIEALLAYLALDTNLAHRRENLVGLLFPEIPDEQARTNLRQTLTRLRRAIHDSEANPSFLSIGRESVQFNSASDHFVDASAFLSFLRGCAAHTGRRDGRCPQCMANAQRALDLYRGPFLDGFFLEDSAAFDDWLLSQRERLQEAALATANQLAAYYERRGEYAAAERAARQQIEIEPWREEAHQQLMRLLAYQGKRGDALRQYQRLVTLLDDELGVEPLPASKKLQRQIAAATGSREHNLPARDEFFVGRSSDLATVNAHLASPEGRLVCLTGPGGSGKTALALETGWRAISLYLGPFIHGVFMVPLVGVAEPVAQPEAPQGAYDPLVTAVAEAINFSPTRDPGRELLNYLSDKRVLLILDNAEHMLDATRDFVGTLLRETAMPKVLVTSRTRLSLTDEWLVEVAGLPVPDLPAPSGPASDPAADDPEPAPTDDAAKLFIQRAQRLSPDIVSAGDSSLCPRSTIIHICRLVQGLPLGVELAASWVRLLSCQEIADELEHSVDFLHSTASDVPERHQSLRAVFDYSWALLGETEREILRRLSIFASTFDRPAAAAVTGATVQNLASLVDYSLLQRRATLSPAVPRYEFLESLRHFAAEKQRSANGDLSLISERFRDYYLDYLAERLEDLRGEKQQAAVQEIALEITNIRAAWRLATESRNFQALATAQESLAMFYYMRSWFAEGEASFALAANQLAGDQLARSAPDAESEILLARLQAWQGWFSFLRGRIGEGYQSLRASVDVMRRYEATSALAGTLPYLAIATSTAGDHVAAEQLANEAHEIGRQAGDLYTQAVAANVLSQICYLQVDYDRARQYGQESLNLLRQSGNYWSMAFSLANLGRAAFAAADYEQAGAYYQEAIDIRQTLGDARGRALGLLYLGDTAKGKQELTSARQAYQESAWDTSTNLKSSSPRPVKRIRRRLNWLKEARPFGCSWMPFKDWPR